MKDDYNPLSTEQTIHGHGDGIEGFDIIEGGGEGLETAGEG